MSDARQLRGTPTVAAAGTPGPPVIVSPPMGWPQPPPPSNAYYSSAQPPEMESLKRDKEDLTNKLNYKSQEVERLNAEVSTLKGQVRNLQQNSYIHGHGHSIVRSFKYCPSAGEGSTCTCTCMYIYVEGIHHKILILEAQLILGNV